MYNYYMGLRFETYRDYDADFLGRVVRLSRFGLSANFPDTIPEAVAKEQRRLAAVVTGAFRGVFGFQEGMLAGFAYGYERRSHFRDPAVEVEDIYVLEGYRGNYLSLKIALALAQAFEPERRFHNPNSFIPPLFGLAFEATPNAGEAPALPIGTISLDPTTLNLQHAILDYFVRLERPDAQPSVVQA